MELETLHLLTLGFTAIAILYADHLGYGYFTGKQVHLDEQKTRFLHRTVTIGLTCMILSGILLALPQWEYLLSEPTFYIKMGFVLVLILNASVIGKMSRLTHSASFRELPADTQKTLFISGALSFIGWVGAAVLGYFFL